MNSGDVLGDSNKMNIYEKNTETLLDCSENRVESLGLDDKMNNTVKESLVGEADTGINGDLLYNDLQRKDSELISSLDENNLNVIKSTKESNNIDISGDIEADEIIAKAMSLRRKSNGERMAKNLRKSNKEVQDTAKSSSNSIFIPRPFFQRLTDSIYRRLIIGSSNQIKLVGLISAARLLVRLYEENTTELPKDESIQHNIPLLSCHVGDWQPLDSDRVVVSTSSLSKEIFGCQKTSHTPPLINRMRTIYIVTPLNYDGNKVGGGYRGGGSDPLSRLVTKWRNLSTADIQDFAYITDNGFDLKYNGFYILYAKSSHPGAVWRQFYSARMRTNAFNSRHQVLINSTHSSRLIKLHTIHLQKDGLDLPIGMALFEDHTEALAMTEACSTTEIKKSADSCSKNGLNSVVSTTTDTITDESTILGGLKSPEVLSINDETSQNNNTSERLNTLNFTIGASSNNSQNILPNCANIINSSLGRDGQSYPNLLEGTINGMNNQLNMKLCMDGSILQSHANMISNNIAASFAKDSVELLLLYSFRSLPQKLQSELIHTISCLKFVHPDTFSAILRSSLDAACLPNTMNSHIQGVGCSNLQSDRISIEQLSLQLRNIQGNLDLSSTSPSLLNSLVSYIPSIPGNSNIDNSSAGTFMSNGNSPNQGLWALLSTHTPNNQGNSVFTGGNSTISQNSNATMLNGLTNSQIIV
ncbi:hypothetical protein cand_007270 [Cryptosporidium andersoni]|uniref:Uncharacterized protein n=1 Tax=Cryptosporidium andersoni TaxID=117008 RepID=A0A1J4MPF0_9CRYT|nr:hypothetical protein cand_007270 [Cryptosporidium andersoni]